MASGGENKKHPIYDLPSFIMGLSDHSFLFCTPVKGSRLTSRRVHLRRLYDVLLLSVQRRDSARAKRAWAILARCDEINWKALWTLGLSVLDLPDNRHSWEANSAKIEYLRAMVPQHPDEV